MSKGSGEEHRLELRLTQGLTINVYEPTNVIQAQQVWNENRIIPSKSFRSLWMHFPRGKDSTRLETTKISYSTRIFGEQANNCGTMFQTSSGNGRRDLFGFRVPTTRNKYLDKIVEGKVYNFQIVGALAICRRYKRFLI